jgi:hypothetical protein
MKYVSVMNGRRSLNGALYSCTINGDAELQNPDLTIYDVLAAVAQEMSQHNAEMEQVEQLAIVVSRPSSALRPPSSP